MNGHLLGKVITLGWSIYIWSNSPKKSWLGHYPTFFWQCQDFESAWSRYPSNQWLEWGQATSSMFSVDIFNSKSYPIQVSKIAQSTELVGDGQGKAMTEHKSNENSHYWFRAWDLVKKFLFSFQCTILNERGSRSHDIDDDVMKCKKYGTVVPGWDSVDLQFLYKGWQKACLHLQERLSCSRGIYLYM